MRFFLTTLASLFLLAPLGHAILHDGRQFAIEAGIEFLEQDDPFVLREQWWDGEVTGGERKVVRQQLFRGNDYWFWVGLSDETKSVQIHIYDENGNLVEEEAFSDDQTAGSRVVPEVTGSYYLVITAPENNGSAPVPWAMVYAYR